MASFMKFYLPIMAGAYLVFAVLQGMKGNWALPTADLLIFGLALGWYGAIK